MRKNVAGQTVTAFLADNSGVAVTTGTTTVYVTGDGGTQASAGSATHEGNGVWSLVPAQADTNYDQISFLFTNAGAVSKEAMLYTSVDSNVISISDDTTAADNLELMFDGTGYIDPSAPASREQVSQISTGSAAISTVAESFVLTTGTVNSGTIDDTKQLDVVHHVIDPVGGNTDVYYEFDVGSDGVPVNIIWDGYAQGGPDEYQMYLWNWAMAVWDQVGEINATSGAVAQVYTLQAVLGHVGTGGDTGKVRFRLASTNGDTLATDRVLCSYAIVRRTVGYAGGSVWMDTTSGNTGVEPFTDGVADNPVSTLGAALTLGGLVSLNRYTLAPNSVLTLDQAFEDSYISGSGANILLNSQSIKGSVIDQVGVNGSDIGTTGGSFPVILNSFILGASMGAHILRRCITVGDITLNESGNYLWDQCSSFLPGAESTGIVFPSGVTQLAVRHHSGGLEFKGMTSDHTVTVEGNGQVIINANCTGGEIHIRGNFLLTDNSGGAVTIVDDARVTNSTIADGMTTFMQATPLSSLTPGTPPANPTFEQASLYMYNALRNKVDVTETTKTYNDDTNTALWKKVISDDGSTYTETKGESV